MVGKKIAVIGGGSPLWGPRIMDDIMARQEFQDSEIALMDINETALQTQAEIGQCIKEQYASQVKVTTSTSLVDSLQDADYIICQVGVGGREGYEQDVSLPMKHGFSVHSHDTNGPAAWSNVLRSAAEIFAIAAAIEKIAPKATLLNYSNPMYVLTSIFSQLLPNPVVGLCTGPRGVEFWLANLVGAQPEEVQARLSGLNHFWWVFDFTVNGENGYDILRKQLDGKSIHEFFATYNKGKPDADQFWNSKIFGDLYDNFGYLSFRAVNHVAEFLPCFILHEKKVEKYGLDDDRDPSKQRYEGWYYRKLMRNNKERILRGKKVFHGNPDSRDKRCRYTATAIMMAALTGTATNEYVNLPNTGQVENMPEGVILEGNAQVDANGVKATSLGKMPLVLKALSDPHLNAYELLIQAIMEKNSDLFVQSLLLNPFCMYADQDTVVRMGREMLRQNNW